MESGQPGTQETLNIQDLSLLLKDFLFLKFKLRGNALVEEVESEKWRSKIKSHSVNQIEECLFFLQTQTRQKFQETLAEKKLEEMQIKGDKKEEVEAEEMEIEEKKDEEGKIEIETNEDSNNLSKPEDGEEISTTEPSGLQPPPFKITYSDSDRSEPDVDSPFEPQIVSVNFVIEHMSDGKDRIRDDWFKLLKAAAIFPYECDPPDASRLMIHFQFKHIHIQLAHASRLGLWDAHNYVRQLGRYYHLDYDHPIRRKYREVDPILECKDTDYEHFEIYSGGFKKIPVHFEDSNDSPDNYANFEDMEDEEREKYMLQMYQIETDKSEG